jgi:hypothetical protein
MSATVTVDTTSLERGLKELQTGLNRVNANTARRQAETTARAIANAVPVRTGTLRSTVTAVATGGGYGVTYGGGLRYAWPQEKRTHAVNSHLDGATRQFRTAAEQAAAKVVGTI